MRSCDRNKRGVCAKQGKGVSVVEERKRRGERVHKQIAEEEIYMAIQVTTNSTSILCRKEGWKKEDDLEL